jgi:hypothetical protein
MSNIFNFRPGKKETHDSDFLKDNDDTVEFVHTGKDVRIGEAPKHFLNPGYADMLLRCWTLLACQTSWSAGFPMKATHGAFSAL